jgi:hypothetical protein
MITTGGIDVGPPNEKLYVGSKASCEQYNIEHELLDAKQLVQL